MFPLDVISPDTAFLHAIREQIEKGIWASNEGMSEFTTLAGAVDAWNQRVPGLIIMDMEVLHQKKSRLAESIQLTATQAVWFFVGEIKENPNCIETLEIFQKPVRLGHLLSRCQFYRRLRQNQPYTTMMLGPWNLVPHLREAQRLDTGETVRLTDKEMRLLEYLYQAQEALPREQILEAIWGYDGSLDTHTLETHITSLRRKLEPANNKSEGSLVLVERGRYSLNVSWLEK